MNIDPNDPRLTAFVLGELDPTERAVVEAYLIDSADCREAVEEIRLTTRWLSEQLQAESRAHHPVEKAGINNHHAAAEIVAKSDVPRRRWWGRPAIRMNLIAAAVLAVVATGGRADCSCGRAATPRSWIRSPRMPVAGKQPRAEANPDSHWFVETAPEAPAAPGAAPASSLAAAPESALRRCRPARIGATECLDHLD